MAEETKRREMGVGTVMQDLRLVLQQMLNEVRAVEVAARDNEAKQDAIIKRSFNAMNSHLTT